MGADDSRIPDDSESPIDELLAPYVNTEAASLIEDASHLTGRERLYAPLARLVPAPFRHRWLDVTITPEVTDVRAGNPVAFEVTISNRAPVTIPVSLTCTALWGWYVDGQPEAESQTPYSGSPRHVYIPGARTYTFDRRWSGYFGRDDGYETPAAGTHTLAARLHVSDDSGVDLADSVEITVRPGE